MDQNILFIDYNYKSIHSFNPDAGNLEVYPLKEILNLQKNNIIITINKPLLEIILNEKLVVLDVLELLAFIYPNKNFPLKLNKLLKEFSITKDTGSFEENIILFPALLEKILKTVDGLPKEELTEIILTLKLMLKGNWEWSSFLLNFLDVSNAELNPADNIFFALDKQIEINTKKNEPATTPSTPHKIIPVTKEDILFELKELTSFSKEKRLNQEVYALSLEKILNSNSKTSVYFSEAGTGIGKTLGYLAPIIAFIKKNPNEKIVISTFTKTLQNQIINELLKNKVKIKSAIIKGKNNYICLLNYEKLLNNAFSIHDGYIYLGFISRLLSKGDVNGEIDGTNTNSFIINKFSSLHKYLLNNSDECIYSYCPFYKKCFINKVKDKAFNANIIISNHSLTMIEDFGANYIVFDEVHHLKTVSDGIFVTEISYSSCFYIKRWLEGRSGKNKLSNFSGLKSRLNTILKEAETKEEENLNTAINNFVTNILSLSKFLPNGDFISTKMARNSSEKFLLSALEHTLKNTDNNNSTYSKESLVENISENFKLNAVALEKDFSALYDGLSRLADLLQEKILLTKQKNKRFIEGFLGSLNRYLDTISAFIITLKEIDDKASKYIYRTFIDNSESRSLVNFGYIKNYTDPMEMFAKNIISPLLGSFFTSATLFSEYSNNMEENKEYLKREFALKHIDNISSLDFNSLSSPFDYKNNSKIIISDREYFQDSQEFSDVLFNIINASNGGVLTIFTAISRLKNVYGNLYLKLLKEDLLLLAQHTQNSSLNSIISLFKEEENSSLLGVDSVRDGIDVPGKSLQIVIFEKIPWDTPTILNTIRVKQKIINQEDNIKFKMKQAFGRLIRREGDKGIFIILSPKVRSSFLNSLPKNIETFKINILESIKVISNFLN